MQRKRKAIMNMLIENEIRAKIEAAKDNLNDDDYYFSQEALKELASHGVRLDKYGYMDTCVSRLMQAAYFLTSDGFHVNISDFQKMILTDWHNFILRVGKMPSHDLNDQVYALKVFIKVDRIYDEELSKMMRGKEIY